MSRFYAMGPFENSTAHTICRDNPAGGDPLIVVTIARIHRPDDLYELCRLANERLEAMEIDNMLIRLTPKGARD